MMPQIVNGKRAVRVDASPMGTPMPAPRSRYMQPAATAQQDEMPAPQIETQ